MDETLSTSPHPLWPSDDDEEPEEPDTEGYQSKVIEAWVCDPPPRGLDNPYKVVRDEWIDQRYRMIRLIYEVKAFE